MNWHLRLSEKPLHAVQMLDGDPPLLCAWTAQDAVWFYAQEDGIYYGGFDLSDAPDDLRSKSWRDYLEGLRAPNGAYLPLVNLGHTVVLTSNDGRLHVYQRDNHQLILDVDGQQTTLDREGDAALLSVGLDRELGTIGVLSDDNRLHIYQQHIYLGAYRVEQDTGKVYVPDKSGTVVLVGKQQIQVFDTAGHIQHQVDASIGAAACAPDGGRLMVADQDVLSAYNARLRLVRQQSVLPLLDASMPVDHEADNDSLLPPTPEALSLSNTGKMAFALGGLICCTHVNQMPALPQPRKLF